MDVTRKRSLSALRAVVISQPKRSRSSQDGISLGAALTHASAAEAVTATHATRQPALLSPLVHHHGRLFPAPPSDPHIAAERDLMDQLPDPLVLKIFQKVPPRELSRKRALISTSWARFARSEELWESFCAPWGLKRTDASRVLGGFRGLYGTIFGSNLVQCSSFERIHHSESPGDKDCYSDAGPFQATSKLLVERIMRLGEIDPEYSARSHWGADADGMQGIFVRGGINSLFRVQVSDQFQTPVLPPPNHDIESCICGQIAPEDADTREEERQSVGQAALVDHDVTCPGKTDAQPPQAGSDAVCTADCTWGCLKQSISLRNFTPDFLDRRPPIQVSAWCASKRKGGTGDEAGLFRLQLAMLGEDKRPLHHWDSGRISLKDNKWRNLSVCVEDYPEGVRSLVVKVAGKGAQFTRVTAGFCP